jgi:hypothetical protein
MALDQNSTEPVASCSEREQLLAQWIDCTSHVTKLFEERLAAMKTQPSSFTALEAQIRVAKAGDAEACRKYFGHLNKHKCV